MHALLCAVRALPCGPQVHCDSVDLAGRANEAVHAYAMPLTCSLYCKAEHAPACSLPGAHMQESSPSTATDAVAPTGYQPSPLQQAAAQLPRIGAELEPFPQVPAQPAAQPATSQSSAVTSGGHPQLPAPLVT